MPTHKGIRCSVVVASKKLDEYDDKNNDADKPDVITRYIDIDGTKGHNFVIEVEALPEFDWQDPSFTRVSCDFKVDGQPFTGGGSIKQCDRINKIAGPEYAEKVNGEELEFLKEMFFGELTAVEGNGLGTNDITDSTDPRLRSMGRIEVLLKRCTRKRAGVPPRARADDSSIVSISEKIMKEKALLHNVQLAAPKQIPISRWSTYNYIDTDVHPFMLFVFLYRTHTYLDNMGIIPHMPFHSELVSRAPTVSPEPDDTSKTREELLAEVQALRGQLRGRGTSSRPGNLKRERSSDGPRAERDNLTKNSKRAKGIMTRPTRGGIVDLTGDD